jgi:hypothetical protein
LVKIFAALYLKLKNDAHWSASGMLHIAYWAMVDEWRPLAVLKLTLAHKQLNGGAELDVVDDI